MVRVFEVEKGWRVGGAGEGEESEISRSKVTHNFSGERGFLGPAFDSEWGGEVEEIGHGWAGCMNLSWGRVIFIFGSRKRWK